MAYLIRILLPDRPGSLGLLADAIGSTGGDIQSVDVVQAFPDGTVMDDMVVSLPSTVMADALITAAHEVEGVEVDSIRPFSGTVDRRGQIQMLAELAAASNQKSSLAQLIDNIPAGPEVAGWDGSYQGDRLSPGVYTWLAQVRLADGSSLVRSGNITLLR